MTYLWTQSKKLEYLGNKTCSMYLQHCVPDPLELGVSQHFLYQISFLWVTAWLYIFAAGCNRSAALVNKSLSGLSQISSDIFMLLAKK